MGKLKEGSVRFLYRVGLTFVVLVFLVPSLAFAQASTSSSNFTLDNINFGTQFVISTGIAGAAPEISTDGPTAVDIEYDQATIRWKTNKLSTSFVRYGTTTSYGREAGSSTLVTDHEVIIFGLTPETLYHYQAYSTDASGARGESTDKTFTTTARAGITSITISDVTYDKALIRWKTSDFTRSKIEYGTTTGYGLSQETASLSFTTEHTVQLTGLTPGTEYHLRIVAGNERGRTTLSSDFTFTTLPRPRFESIVATFPSPNEAIITWRTNTANSGIVSYAGTKDPIGSESTAGDSRLLKEHSISLKNLIGKSEYRYRITATDAQGSQVTSEQRTFTTPADTTPPVLSDLKVSTANSGGRLILTATWKTDESTSGQISFSSKSNADDAVILPKSTGFSLEHTFIATEVKPSTAYTLKAISLDPYDNRGEAEISFVSSKLSKSIFQLILQTFLNAFGWLANLAGG